MDRIATCVTELIAAFNGQAMSPQMAGIRARGFLTALDDLPPWSVEEACRRWLRGEAGDQNYSFAPSPPQLRGIAIEARDRLVYYRKALERLLGAIVDREYTLEHRHKMLTRLEELFRRVGASTTRASVRRKSAA